MTLEKRRLEQEQKTINEAIGKIQQNAGLTATESEALRRNQIKIEEISQSIEQSAPANPANEYRGKEGYTEKTNDDGTTTIAASPIPYETYRESRDGWKEDKKNVSEYVPHEMILDKEGNLIKEIRRDTYKTLELQGEKGRNRVERTVYETENTDFNKNIPTRKAVYSTYNDRDKTNEKGTRREYGKAYLREDWDYNEGTIRTLEHGKTEVKSPMSEQQRNQIKNLDNAIKAKPQLASIRESVADQIRNPSRYRKTEENTDLKAKESAMKIILRNNQGEDAKQVLSAFKSLPKEYQTNETLSYMSEKAAEQPNFLKIFAEKTGHKYKLEEKGDIETESIERDDKKWSIKSRFREETDDDGNTTRTSTEIGRLGEKGETREAEIFDTADKTRLSPYIKTGDGGKAVDIDILGKTPEEKKFKERNIGEHREKKIQEWEDLKELTREGKKGFDADWSRLRSGKPLIELKDKDPGLIEKAREFIKRKELYKPKEAKAWLEENIDVEHKKIDRIIAGKKKGKLDVLEFHAKGELKDYLSEKGKEARGSAKKAAVVLGVAALPLNYASGKVDKLKAEGEAKKTFFNRYIRNPGVEAGKQAAIFSNPYTGGYAGFMYIAQPGAEIASDPSKAGEYGKAMKEDWPDMVGGIAGAWGGVKIKNKAFPTPEELTLRASIAEKMKQFEKKSPTTKVRNIGSADKQVIRSAEGKPIYEAQWREFTGGQSTSGNTIEMFEARPNGRIQKIAEMDLGEINQKKAIIAEGTIKDLKSGRTKKVLIIKDGREINGFIQNGRDFVHFTKSGATKGDVMYWHENMRGNKGIMPARRIKYREDIGKLTSEQQRVLIKNRKGNVIYENLEGKELTKAELLKLQDKIMESKEVKEPGGITVHPERKVEFSKEKQKLTSRDDKRGTTEDTSLRSESKTKQEDRTGMDTKRTEKNRRDEVSIGTRYEQNRTRVQGQKTLGWDGGITPAKGAGKARKRIIDLSAKPVKKLTRKSELIGYKQEPQDIVYTKKERPDAPHEKTSKTEKTLEWDGERWKENAESIREQKQRGFHKRKSEQEHRAEIETKVTSRKGIGPWIKRKLSDIKSWKERKSAEKRARWGEREKRTREEIESEFKKDERKVLSDSLNNERRFLKRQGKRIERNEKIQESIWVEERSIRRLEKELSELDKKDSGSGRLSHGIEQTEKNIQEIKERIRELESRKYKKVKITKDDHASRKEKADSEEWIRRRERELMKEFSTNDINEAYKRLNTKIREAKSEAERTRTERWKKKQESKDRLEEKEWSGEADARRGEIKGLLDKEKAKRKNEWNETKTEMKEEGRANRLAREQEERYRELLLKKDKSAPENAEIEQLEKEIRARKSMQKAEQEKREIQGLKDEIKKLEEKGKEYGTDYSHGQAILQEKIDRITKKEKAKTPSERKTHSEIKDSNREKALEKELEKATSIKKDIIRISAESKGTKPRIASIPNISGKEKSSSEDKTEAKSSSKSESSSRSRSRSRSKSESKSKSKSESESESKSESQSRSKTETETQTNTQTITTTTTPTRTVEIVTIKGAGKPLEVPIIVSDETTAGKGKKEWVPVTRKYEDGNVVETELEGGKTLKDALEIGMEYVDENPEVSFSIVKKEGTGRRFKGESKLDKFSFRHGRAYEKPQYRYDRNKEKKFDKRGFELYKSIKMR